MKRNLWKLVFSVVVLTASGLTLSACTVIGRGVGSMVGNDSAQAQAGVTWLVPAPELDPPLHRTVYLTVRDISGASVDVRRTLQAGIENLGYTIIKDSRNAQFRLRVTVRYFGKNDQADGGRQQAALLGGITGAAVGLGTANVTGSLAAGIAGGGLTGVAMSNVLKTKEWDLIADILVEERLAKTISIQINSERSRGSGNATAATTGYGGAQGQTNFGGAVGGTVSTTKMTKRTNYFPHGVRVSVWARQIRMTEQEALPLIEKKLQAVVPGLLP